MTRKSRMFAAFRREPVDRAPFSTYNLHPFTRTHADDPSYANVLDLVLEKSGMLCKVGVGKKSRDADQDQEIHYAAPGFMTQRVEAIARVANGRTGYVMTPTCTPFQHPATDTYLRNYTEWIEAADRLLT